MLKLKYELPTLINFISSILWYLSNIDNNLYTYEYINSIKDKYRTYGKSIKETIDKNKMGKEFELTEKEKKSFMKWEDILEFYKHMSKDLIKTSYTSKIDFFN